MGGVKAEGFGVHAGGGVVVVHDLHENAVACIQGRTIGYIDGGIALRVLNEQGGIAGVDLGAALQIDGILALMGHKAEGIGVDDSGFILLCLISLGNLTVCIHQLIGFPCLQIGIGAGAAGEDRGIGTHIHGNAQELLVSGADHIGAVAGALGEGVGIAVFVLIGAVGLHDLIIAGKIHGGIDHVELHIGAGIRGQNRPAGCGRLGVDDVHGGVIALQIGAAGRTHDTEDPRGSDHGVLRGRVFIAVMQRTAVRVQLGIPDGKGGAGICEQGHVGNAGHVDIRVLNGELGTLPEGGDGGTLAGEVTGLQAVAVSVKANGGLGNGIVDPACDDNAVKAGVGAVDGDILGVGGVIHRILTQSVGDGLFIHYAVLVDKQRSMIGIVIVGFICAARGKGRQPAGCIVQIIGVDHLGLVGVGIHSVTAVEPGDLAIYQQRRLLAGRGGNIRGGAGIGGTAGCQCRGRHQGGAQSQTHSL